MTNVCEQAALYSALKKHYVKLLDRNQLATYFYIKSGLLSIF